MPSELRIVRFKLDEVGTALRALAPRIELEVPEGNFVSAASDCEQETPATSFVLGEQGNTFTIANGKLAASLIHYCQNFGIPLSREGNKEIYVSEKFIELRIAIRHPASAKEQTPAASPEPAAAAPEPVPAVTPEQAPAVTIDA